MSLAAALGVAHAPSVSAKSAAEDVAAASSAAAYLAGRFALARGDLGVAAAGLDRALNEVPEDDDLRRQVFILAVASGDWKRASEHAGELVFEDAVGGGEEAQLYLAVDAVDGLPEELARRIAAIDDNSLPGLIKPLLQAWAEPDPATGAALLAVDDSRLGDLVTYHRVLLLDLAGEPEEALAALADIGNEPTAMPDRMLAQQARLLALSGEIDAAAAMIRLGSADRRQSDILRATAAALESGEIPPAVVANRRQGFADALLGVAEILRNQRRPLQATAYARLGLAAADDFDPAWLALGGLLAEQGGPELAVDAMGKIDERSPWYWTAQVQMAQYLAETGDVEQAVERLSEQVTSRPDDASAPLALGDLLRREEKFDEAADAYLTAIDRTQPVAEQHWRLYYARGIALERGKRWPEAEGALLKALELQPDQPFVLNYLGYSWVDQGLELERAQDMLVRAVELRPNDGFIVDSLGWAHFRLGHYEEAVKYLERAVELEPGDPVINDHLGDAYWRVGREREAEFQWKRVLVFDPEEDVAASVDEKLKSGLPEKDA